MHDLLQPNTQYLTDLTHTELSPLWFQVQPDCLYTACAHLHHVLFSLVTIYNEMRLPPCERAGALPAPPQLGRRARSTPGSHPQPEPPLTREEDALSKLLQRFRDQGVITVTNVNQALGASTGYRNKQQEVAALFDFAQSLGIGTREGLPQRNGKLLLKLHQTPLPQHVRDRLRLRALAPDAPPQLPPMNGGGVPRGLIPSMFGGAKRKYTPSTSNLPPDDQSQALHPRDGSDVVWASTQSGEGGARPPARVQVQPGLDSGSGNVMFTDALRSGADSGSLAWKSDAPPPCQVQEQMAKGLHAPLRTNGDGGCSLHALLGAPRMHQRRMELFCPDARLLAAEALQCAHEAAVAGRPTSRAYRCVETSLWNELVYPVATRMVCSGRRGRPRGCASESWSYWECLPSAAQRQILEHTQSRLVADAECDIDMAACDSACRALCRREYERVIRGYAVLAGVVDSTQVDYLSLGDAALATYYAKDEKSNSMLESAAEQRGGVLLVKGTKAVPFPTDGPRTKYEALFDPREYFDPIRRAFLLPLSRYASRVHTAEFFLGELDSPSGDRSGDEAGLVEVIGRFAQCILAQTQSNTAAPACFSAVAWPTLFQAVQRDTYYLSCDELLVVAEGAGKNLIVCKRGESRGDFVIEGCVDGFTGAVAVVYVMNTDNMYRVRSHFERLAPLQQRGAGTVDSANSRGPPRGVAGSGSGAAPSASAGRGTGVTDIDDDAPEALNTPRRSPRLAQKRPCTRDANSVGATAPKALRQADETPAGTQVAIQKKSLTTPRRSPRLQQKRDGEGEASTLEALAAPALMKGEPPTHRQPNNALKRRNSDSHEQARLVVRKLSSAGSRGTADDARAIQAAITGKYTVRGEPIDCSVYVKNRLRQSVDFRVCCNSCQPRTCSWAATAASPRTARTHVTLWVKKAGTHGLARAPRGAKTKGRPRHATKHVTWKGASWEHNVESPMTRPKLYEEVQRRLRGTAKAPGFDVNPRKRPARCGVLAAQLFCISHKTPEGSPCPWVGRVNYNLKSGTVRVTGPPLEAHGAIEIKNHRGVLSTRQRLIKETCDASADAADVLQKLEDPEVVAELPDSTTVASPPKLPQVHGLLKRERQASRPAHELPRARCGWRAHDLQFVVDRTGVVAPPTAQRDDSRLRVVDAALESPDRTHIALLCPKHVRTTLSLVTNRRYVKLSLDGTFRMVFGNYFLLTVGLNTKHWTRVASAYKFTSTFHELGFALAHSENARAYQAIVDAVLTVSDAVGVPIAPADIRQWHSDLHLGIKLAHDKIAPHSQRVLDWAHVTGATNAGKGGLPAMLRSHAPDAQEFVMHWAYTSRTCPDPVLFDIIWRNIFSILGGTEEVEEIKHTYFTEVEYQGETLIAADWNIGFHRVQPGSAAGSAPQEAWHKNSLKKEIPETYQNVATLVARLQSYVTKRMNALNRDGVEPLGDWPDIGVHADIYSVENNPQLRKEGRSSAVDLLSSGLTQRHEDSDGDVFAMIPRSLLKVDSERSTHKTKHYIEKSVEPLEQGTAQAMAAMLKATHRAEKEQALESLRLGERHANGFRIIDWRRTSRLIGQWCTVISGPFVNRFWEARAVRASEVPEGERTRVMHLKTLCAFCKTSAVTGPCEHSYSHLMSMGEPGLSRDIRAAEKPKVGRPRSIQIAGQAPADPPLVLVPGDAHNQASSTRQHASHLPKGSSAAELRLQRVLSAHGLSEHYRQMVVDGGAAVIATLAPGDLFSIYRIRPLQATALLRDLNDAQQSHAVAPERDAESSVRDDGELDVGLQKWFLQPTKRIHFDADDLIGQNRPLCQAYTFTTAPIDLGTGLESGLDGLDGTFCKRCLRCAESTIRDYVMAQYPELVPSDFST